CALQLASRERADRAMAEAAEADAFQRALDFFAVCAVEPAKSADAPPQAHCHHVENRHWKTGVEFGLLRQVGDFLACHAEAVTAFNGFQLASDCFQQRGFSRAVGTDYGKQRAA